MTDTQKECSKVMNCMPIIKRILFWLQKCIPKFSWKLILLILGQTPLHVAARLKKFEIFQYLHAKGADLLQKDFNGENFFQL